MKKNIQNILTLVSLTLFLFGCEKEIHVDLPPSQIHLVVEASVNQLSPILNYVFITKSVDYFNPDLSLGGLENATVTITEGRISGSDTIYDMNPMPFFNINSIPGADTLFVPFDSIISLMTGLYFNPAFAGKENTSYRLSITLADGSHIEGTTTIPAVVPIDTIKYQFTSGPDDSGRYNVTSNLFWFDPPGQNNYRMAIKRGFYGSVLIGWGAADNYRTFDDELQNNQVRFSNLSNRLKTKDTISVYFTSINRKEYLFWQSFGQASNGPNPFSSPVSLKSNITGAIGTFTGYAVSYRQVIFK